MRRDIGLVFAALACATGLLSACDDPPEDGSALGAPTPPPSPLASATSSPDATGDGPPTSSPPTGAGTTTDRAEDSILRVAVQEPTVLDPMRAQDPASVLIARQLFEGLTRWDQRRKKVVPAAAASWRTRDGGRRFVFTLRKGMTFHDGTRVTAQDFAFAFDRIARKRNAADIAYTLEPIKGFDAVNQFGKRSHLSGVSTPDKRTVVIELSEPFQDFPAVLAHPGLVPLPKDAVANLDEFLLEPVGNGPFRMAKPWAASGEVELEAFNGFYDPPRIDGIRFIPFPDAALSWIEFLDGNIDVSEVPGSEIDAAAEAFGTEGYQPLLAGYYYGINVAARDLRSRKLRVAMNRAIDRKHIADSIYKGTMRPARGIVPRGMPGFAFDACGRLCDHDRSKARRLVRALPKKRRSLTLEYTKGAPHDKVARAVKRDLVAVGLKVKVKAYGFERYLKLLRAGKQSLYRLGWIAEYPSPDVFLTALFGSKSPDNHSGFGSKRVDRVLDRARRANKERKQVSAYRRAERLILEAVPIVPIGSFESHWAARDGVKGLSFDVMGGFDAARATIEPPPGEEE